MVSYLLNVHKLTSVGILRKKKEENFTPIHRNTWKCNKLFSFWITVRHYSGLLNFKEKRNPETVTFYNDTKTGVDVTDVLCATLNGSRNSRRWPSTIFYAMLNISNTNANIIYRDNNYDTRTKRQHFLKKTGTRFGTRAFTNPKGTC